MLMVPTMPAPCTIAEVEADPIGPNSRLGIYTNFVNLLDLAGIAVPTTLAADGTPFGITLLGPAGRDAQLASVGLAMHARTDLPLGALGVPRPDASPLVSGLQPGERVIAVVGAHLSGMALNHELTNLGGRFVYAATTGQDYRLFALDGAPPRPGLLRVAPGTGTAIALEAWALPTEGFGRFVASVPRPVHRHDHSRRWEQGQGLPGRGGRRGGRARYIELWRVARFRYPAEITRSARAREFG